MLGYIKYVTLCDILGRKKKKQHIKDIKDNFCKICLRVNGQQFWLVSDLPYKSVEKLESGEFLEVYQLVTLSDDRYNLFFDVGNEEWRLENGHFFWDVIWANRYRKAIYFLEIMTCYIKIYLIEELLGSDISYYIRNVLIKHIDLEMMQRISINKK